MAYNSRVGCISRHGHAVQIPPAGQSYHREVAHESQHHNGAQTVWNGHCQACTWSMQ